MFPIAIISMILFFVVLIGFPKASAKLLLYFISAKLLQEIFRRFFAYFAQLADLQQIKHLLKDVNFMLYSIKTTFSENFALKPMLQFFQKFSPSRRNTSRNVPS